jgi:small subunit ribosomal protein S1
MSEDHDNILTTDENFEEMLASSFNFSYSPPRRGEIREATILQIDEREIIVDLGAKQDGIVPSQDLERMDDQFRESLAAGASIPVYVVNPRDQNDNLIVSINMGLQRYDWEKASELLTSQDAVDVKVSGYNKGGALVRWNRLEGFIPSSHLVSAKMAMDRREAMSELIGSTLGVKVIEVDQDRRRLIFSEREAQKEWRAKRKQKLLAELNVGDVVNGVVTGLRDFGAFVNIGGADGLIHVSELAWHRVDHPRDILAIGDEIEVYVLNLDRETNRIALSRKRLLSDPWDEAQYQYHEGQLIEGQVTNVVDFGAFVALDDGLEGLLHLSEMGDGALKEPYSYVQKGDQLSLRISHLEPEKRRVGFTQRWGTEAEEAEKDGEDVEAEDSQDVEAEDSDDSEDKVAELEEPIETSAADPQEDETVDAVESVTDAVEDSPSEQIVENEPETTDDED